MLYNLPQTTKYGFTLIIGVAHMKYHCWFHVRYNLSILKFKKCKNNKNMKNYF
jgi:hypothetical protein